MFALLVLLAALPVHAALQTENTSTYVGGGRWNWSVFINADDATLRQIECVEYTLHPTFPDPVRRICNRESKFALTSNGWGTFTIQVRILYRDGRSEQRAHPLVFTHATAGSAPNLTASNWSRELEPGWWEWGVQLEGAARDLDRVRCVEYTLHPTFPNPVRMVCTRANRFQLTARGWGAFTISIKVLYKDGSMQPLSHPLQFR